MPLDLQFEDREGGVGGCWFTPHCEIIVPVCQIRMPGPSSLGSPVNARHVKIRLVPPKKYILHIFKQYGVVFCLAGRKND